MKNRLRLLLIFSVVLLPLKQINPQELNFEEVLPEVTPYFGTVNSIYQDYKGFIWLGTSNGLFRYDGYSVKSFKHNPADKYSISGNFIWSVCGDENGDLWIGTSGKGLNKYIWKENRFIHFLHNPSDSTSLAGSDEVPFVYKDDDGSIMAALWESGLDSYDFNENKFRHRLFTIIDEEGVPRNSVHRVFRDKYGDLWVGTKRGLFRVKKGESHLMLYRNITSDPNSIGGNNIYSIIEDLRGNLWVGSYGGGISRFIRSENKFKVYKNNPDDHNTISSNLITSMCIDSSGFIWIGTDDNGLNKFNPVNEKFYPLKSSKENNPLINRISSLSVDKSGVLWIGTVGSGLFKYSPNKIKFKRHRVQLDNNTSAIIDALLETGDGKLLVGTVSNGLYFFNEDLKSYKHFLAGKTISALCEDKSGNIWIGTDEGLKYFDITLENFTYLTEELPKAYINSLLLDSNGNLWIGTDGEGISILQTKTGKLINHNLLPESLFQDLVHVFALFEDSKKNIWIGCWGAGAVKYDPVSNSVIKYNHDPYDSLAISGYNVISIEEDKNCNLWFGTNTGGLNKLDTRRGKFTRYTTADGLPNENVYAILCDDNNNLWMSTSSGVARFDHQKNLWKVFDIQDGIQSQEFRQGSFYKSRNGSFYFGGIYGFNSFLPAEVKDNPNKPEVVVTSVKIFGKELSHYQSDAAAEIIKNLDLSYDQNNISFEFASLDFTNPVKNQYAYRMEGVDEDWNYIGTPRIASYTNLSPGQYLFRVKGSNNDGTWNDEGTSIKISISPPPWKTWWAYTLYVLAFITILYFARKYELNRLRLKNQLALEHIEAEKLKELDQLKSKFFINISHEFRTPLTLILGPLEEAISRISSEDIKRQLKSAQANSKKLLRLINQLLDLSKLEAGKMKIKISRVELISFLKGIIFTFDSLAKQKGITLQFESKINEAETYIDTEKMEQVFYNLMSNALKFTQTGSNGKVIVSVQVPHKSTIQIRIKDNGIGIPVKDLPNIFNRFYRADELAFHESEGTGIGLALTKEIIELHSWEIIVNSELGKGTEFIITLPFGKEQFKNKEVAKTEIKLTTSLKEIIKEDSISVEQEVQKEEIKLQEDNREIVLIVEDNSDVRNFIYGQLKSGFKIIEAVNGSEGFEKAALAIPDLIVSDVMMPEMNGYSLCTKLKSDERTSHIPLILLTAKGGEESRLEGLETGADDYLTKPFSSKELLIRIKNLIELRKRLREKFSKDGFLKPEKVSASPVDIQFLEKVKDIIEKNISNDKFSVETLAGEAALSRVQLHRKLKAITDQSASEFILNLRLQKAAELIKQNAASVSEIAYMTGFNTPNYFAKCFRKQYGCSPTEYKQKTGLRNQ